jgi:hypothetical protein
LLKGALNTITLPPYLPSSHHYHGITVTSNSNTSNKIKMYKTVIV